MMNSIRDDDDDFEFLGWDHEDQQQLIADSMQRFMQSDNTYDETEIRKMIREMIFCFTTGDEP